MLVLRLWADKEDGERCGKKTGRALDFGAYIDLKRKPFTLKGPEP